MARENAKLGWYKSAKGRVHASFPVLIRVQPATLSQRPPHLDSPRTRRQLYQGSVLQMSGTTQQAQALSDVGVDSVEYIRELERRVSLGSATACMALGDELAKSRDVRSWSCAVVVYLAGIGWSCPLQNVACPASSLEPEALGPINRSGAVLDLEPCVEHLTIQLSRHLASLLDRFRTIPDRFDVGFADRDFPVVFTSSSAQPSPATLFKSALRWASEPNPTTNSLLAVLPVHPSVIMQPRNFLSARTGRTATQGPVLDPLSSKTQYQAPALQGRSQSPSPARSEDSASSSSPSSSRRLKALVDTDEQERLETDLNDSPATTPSRASSAEDVAETLKPKPSPFWNILQERLAWQLDIKRTRPRSHTQSSSISFLSGTVSPVSTRSVSSVRSTASSITSRICGEPKTHPSTHVFAEQNISTMGSFTPVSATTAANSLRHFRRANPTSKPNRSRLGLLSQWDTDEEPRSDSAPKVSKPIRRNHNRSATTDAIPSISLTHSSFRPDSHVQAGAATFIPTRPQPRSSRTLPSPKIGLPPMDPTLAALEKTCRLKAKVNCVVCGKAGWDFAKNRAGQAICSRDCRISLKARESGLIVPVIPASLNGKGRVLVD